MSALFGDAVHLAYVVPDIQVAMRQYTDRGFGPIYLLDRIASDAICRGERCNPCISAAFFNSGNVQIELIQPHDNTPNAYREYLEHNPQGGLHHIAYWTEDFEAALANAAAKGFHFSVVQEFVLPDGTPYEIYVELDAPTPGPLVQLMVESPVRAFFERVAGDAATWDGKDPIRDGLPILAASMDLDSLK